MSGEIASARCLVLDEVDSTNAEAARRLGAGLDHALAVIARAQTAGRGRQGRAWQAPAGNLNLSVVFRSPLAVAQQALVGFAACLAVGDLIAELAPDAELRFKWPNDVLVNGRKVAGILLEAGGVPGREGWLIVGIGVNLIASPAGLERAPGAPEAGSVRGEGGRPADVEEAARIALARLDDWHGRLAREGFAPLRTAWLARAVGLGRRIEAELPRGRISGLFEDMDADGRLVLRTADGTRRISAADIYFPE